MSLTIFWDGEPTPHPKCLAADLCVSASGFGSEEHTNVAFMPTTACEGQGLCPDWKPSTTFEDRTYDILYRSSNCNGTTDRDNLARIIREEADRRGLTFVATGKCLAGGKRTLPADGDRRFEGEAQNVVPSTRPCKDCQNAKVMLAFDNFVEEERYLSEKVLFPMMNGAVSAYYGNGQDAMDMIGLNREKIIDRLDFQSDREFANALLDVASDKDKFNRLTAKPNFTKDLCGESNDELYKDVIRAAGNSNRIREFTESEICAQGVRIQNRSAFLPTASSSKNIVSAENIVRALGCKVDTNREGSDVVFRGRFE